MSEEVVVSRIKRAERAVDLLRLYKELSRAKLECFTCKGGRRCKEPHGKPYKTLAWVFAVRETTIIAQIQGIEDDLRQQSRSHAREHEEQVLRNLQWVEAEAIAEWERSKLPITQTTTESSTSGTGIESGPSLVKDRRTRAQKILREQTGDVAYLSTILAVQVQRRAIWGLDVPKRIIPLNPDGTGVFEFMRDLAKDALSNVIDVTPPREMVRQLEYSSDDLPELEDVQLDAPG